MGKKGPKWFNLDSFLVFFVRFISIIALNLLKDLFASYSIIYLKRLYSSHLEEKKIYNDCNCFFSFCFLVVITELFYTICHFYNICLFRVSQWVHLLIIRIVKLNFIRKIDRYFVNYWCASPIIDTSKPKNF